MGVSDGAEATDVARAAGAVELLRKPVRQSRLYDALVTLAMPGLERRREEVASPAPRPRGCGGLVLLVEDNPANQLVGRRIVEKLGYRVDVVADGREALEALLLRSYDAVLMDRQMPVMDGFEATRRLREDEGTQRRTPVIAMTAGLATAAHGLRGAAANLGAVHLARSAKRLEDAAERGAVPVGEDELDRLVHELDRTRAALRAAVGGA